MSILAYVMKKEIKKYKAIGEENRLRILKILLKVNTELCVCEIVDTLNKPQYTISKHLGILRNAELVEERRDGKLILYTAKNSDPLNKKIFSSIKFVNDDKTFKQDLKNLKKRLSLRKNGKIVVTKCN